MLMLQLSVGSRPSRGRENDADGTGIRRRRRRKSRCCRDGREAHYTLMRIEVAAAAAAVGSDDLGTLLWWWWWRWQR